MIHVPNTDCDKKKKRDGMRSDTEMWVKVWFIPGLLDHNILVSRQNKCSDWYSKEMKYSASE